MKLKLAFFALITISNYGLCQGSTGSHEIHYISQRECTSDTRGFEITLKSKHQNPDDCIHGEKLTVSCQHKAFDQLTSISLVALTSGMQITAWVDGCNAEGKAQVDAIRLGHK